MASAQQYLDQVLFGVAPYLALIIFFLGTIQRYRSQAFTYSSLSSQFLENQRHFWGMVPLHYGIIIVLLGHMVAFLFPRTLLAWNGHPIRLYILEITALIFGLLTLLGLLSTVARRLAFSKVRTVTSTADIILYLLLLTQVGSGVYVAVMHSWGSSWFAASAAPYLWSIVTLDPDISYVLAMPFAVKLHIVNACLTIGFFPLYAAGAHSGGSQPVPVAQAAGSPLEPCSRSRNAKSLGAMWGWLGHSFDPVGTKSCA